MKPVKKIVVNSLLLCIPVIYGVFCSFLNNIQQLSPFIENLVFGFPFGFILFLTSIYNYPLALIFGIGEGKQFVGEGFVLASSPLTAISVMLFYFVFFCVIISTIHRKT